MMGARGLVQGVIFTSIDRDWSGDDPGTFSLVGIPHFQDAL